VPPASGLDPIPLSPAQLGALASAAAQELAWGLPAVSREIAGWRTLAGRIEHPQTRRIAIASLAGKRGHIDGAALFWILARRRDRGLLRLLVAYDVLCDYLDGLTEQTGAGGLKDARRLHLAMTDALEPGGGQRDWFACSREREDGGYLHALVETCRAACAALPAFATVQPLALREARRASAVLPLNHLPAARREAELRAWAAGEPLGRGELAWFEQGAAASTWLAVQASLALAADPSCAAATAEAVCAAYFPWCSLAGTMLDSYVDEADDLAAGDHRYVAHYPSRAVMLERLELAVERAATRVRALADGHRHAVIFACMVAMYLSKESARARELRGPTRRLAACGGTLTRTLVPILRIWRLRYGQRSA
jgi:tetraprenyl-beta-curcumene synthase